MSTQWFPNCYTWIDGQTDAGKLTDTLFIVLEAEYNVIQIWDFTLTTQKLCSHQLFYLQTTHLLNGWITEFQHLKSLWMLITSKALSMPCPMDFYRKVLTHHRVLKHCSDPAVDTGVVRIIATSFQITDSVLKMVLILLKFSSSSHEIQEVAIVVEGFSFMCPLRAGDEFQSSLSFLVCVYFRVRMCQCDHLTPPTIPYMDQDGTGWKLFVYNYCNMYEWLLLGFGLVIGFIEHLQIITISNYCATENSHALQFTTACTKSSQSGVYSAVVRWRIPTLSSASLLMFLPTGNRPTTNSQAGGHLTPTSYSSDRRLKMAAGLHYIGSASTAQRTPLLTTLLLLHASRAAITYQWPLFTEPLLKNGSRIAAYFVVIA
jgi:hypothetical protein